MSALPKERAAWFALMLFPFKAYSVLGIIAFSVWHFGHYHFGWGTWQFYDKVGGCILMGYIVSLLALLLGGCIQRFALKTAAASSSFVFSAVDAFVVLVLPMFFHA